MSARVLLQQGVLSRPVGIAALKIPLATTITREVYFPGFGIR